MNAKVFTALLFCFSVFGCSVFFNNNLLNKKNEVWQTNTYSKIGLKIRLPNWNLDVDDQNRRWFLFAYPLVETPNDDAQYRVVISVLKLPETEYLRIYPKVSTKSSDWINSQHLNTSQMTNTFWIFFRKDILCTNGFAYNCTAHIKRIQNPEPDSIKKIGGDERILTADLLQIFDSIEALPANALSRWP
jgi:hypothetical protein